MSKLSAPLVQDAGLRHLLRATRRALLLWETEPAR